MSDRLLQVAIQVETDVVLARQRTRQLAEIIGFDKQDQTRITTAVSEIARNAFEYGGGGRVEFFLIGTEAPQLLEIVVSDKGPGIDNVKSILDGTQRSTTGLGLGIVGARRLMDQFTLDSSVGVGTVVKLRKFLPGRLPVIATSQMPALVAKLEVAATIDPLAEIRRQNQELLMSLDQLKRQHDELSRLNEELEDTNRGVVALYAELDERADHLRRADELKSRFLSDISHEFRTPLNSIMALARLLLDRIDGDLTPDQEKQVRFIRRSAENLTDLVNDLLDMAKVEAGKVDVKPIEFTLENLFGALRGMLRPLLVSDKLTLVFEEVDNLPPLFGDESKVSQILRNLISNALKFTEHGEVRVSANLTEDKSSILISVQDTGLGIAPEHLDMIFEEFVQLDNPAQRKFKGTGLGLPLSRKLAVLLQGHISVSSKVDQGSTFTLCLPLNYEAPAADSDGVPTGSTRSALGLPVLAIEDDPIDLHILEKTLENSRYDFYTARTTADARRWISHSPPAAILLDLVLAGESSWKFLANLKQDLQTAQIPVIVISTLEDEQKALTVGADAYLRKPVDRIALLSALAKVVLVPRPVRALLIEDDEAFRYIIRQFLPAHKYVVVEAATGMDGLAIAADTQFDVLLLDVNLPEMSGPKVIEELDKKNSGSRLPIVIITAGSSPEHKLVPLDRVSAVLLKEDLSTELLTSTIELAVRTPVLSP